MNELTIFNNDAFGELSVIVVNGTELFGAVEVAKILSFGNPHDAVKNHIEKDDLADHEVIDRLGRNQKKKFVNESGLYDLIFGAARQGNNPEIKEKAKKFKRWVTSDVLPSIRKHGAYMTDNTLEKALTSPDFLIQLANKLKEEQTLRLEAEEKVKRQQPKVLFANAVETSESSVLIGELAKIIKQNGVDVGQKRLFDWLRDNGYLIRKKGEEYNNPTQKSMELGLFEIKKRAINNPDGSVRVTKTPKVTGKGQIYFVNKFLNEQKNLRSDNHVSKAN